MRPISTYKSAIALIALAALLGVSPAARSQDQGVLKVCCATTDLGSISKEVGGDQVEVTTFVKGPEDPHFIEAKPGFVKALSEADFFVVIGMELEIGWAPVLLQNCRNKNVLVGNPGYVDVSSVIKALETPAGTVDRSMGDIHAQGNPHYLSDPLNGLKAAGLLRDRFTDKRPDKKEYFAKRFEDFRSRIGTALVGEALAKKYNFEKLALLGEQGKLVAFLKSQKDDTALGGWLGRLAPYYGAKVIADHNLWPYFSKRFGIEVVGFLEPKPGIAPTTKHLSEVIGLMKAQGVKAILSVPYFDSRHAEIVVKATNAKIAALAHQSGGRNGTGDYITFVDYNVKQLATALGG